MRYTLEQLKAMSATQLGNLWACGTFPFEWLSCGSGCLTMHSHRTCKRHPEMTANVQPLHVCLYGPTGDAQMPEFSQNLKAHLEELYALRLFYDALYPQTEQPGTTAAPSQSLSSFAAQPDVECGQQPATDELAFARMEETYHDSRSNT